jgi:glyoxylase-like metal-dependent hydrolase (beta-lactamase superfamily II)/ferredoxin
MMADPKRRLAANAAGPWFVDETCINCDACRQYAPEIFAEIGEYSAVKQQPQTAEQTWRAELALLACPTGSIGALGHRISAQRDFPLEIEGGVAICGYNAEASFGANAFFVRRAEGNYLIDSPRFVASLVKRIEAAGGIADMLLTHRDDVADAGRFAKHFGARVWIHETERSAAPFATDLLVGLEAQRIRDGMLAIPVPGHTRGSVVYLLEDNYLFTGDSLCWSRERADLHAFRSACWHSWTELRQSLARLADYDFAWVLAGHGDRQKLPRGELRQRLLALVERMGQGGD